MSKVFNTDFELSLRTLMLLSVCKKEISLDKILALDFITIYGRNFGISQESLNGENEFCFSELAYRRELLKIATQELVLNNLVKVSSSDSGFVYSINERGNSLCDSLDSKYAHEYMTHVEDTLRVFGAMSENELMQEIGNRSRSNVQRI